MVELSDGGSVGRLSARIGLMRARARIFAGTSLAALAAEVKVIAEEALDVETPSVSGNLKRSTSAAVQITPAGLVVSFTSTAPYASYVIHGTGVPAGHSEYDIFPSSKQALYWTGAIHPVRRVHRVGNKPNNYPERAAARALPAQRLVLRRVGKVVWFGGGAT